MRGLEAMLLRRIGRHVPASVIPDQEPVEVEWVPAGWPPIGEVPLLRFAGGLEVSFGRHDAVMVRRRRDGYVRLDEFTDGHQVALIPWHRENADLN